MWFRRDNIHDFDLSTGYGPGRVSSLALSWVQFSDCGQRGTFIVWHSFGLPQHGALKSWPCEFWLLFAMFACLLARISASPQVSFLFFPPETCYLKINVTMKMPFCRTAV